MRYGVFPLHPAFLDSTINLEKLKKRSFVHLKSDEKKLRPKDGFRWRIQEDQFYKKIGRNLRMFENKLV